MDIRPRKEKPVVTLSCAVDDHGIIRLVASGRMTKDVKDDFKAWVREIERTVVDRAAAHPGDVRILADVSKIEHFERELLDDVKELFNFDKQYVTKSAVVGAPRYLAMIIDAVVMFTGRTNVKQFPSERDALNWLSDSRT